MDDNQLAYWGRYGRSVGPASSLLNLKDVTEDVMVLWRLFGELEEKVREQGS